jgi:hypothetical protein
MKVVVSAAVDREQRHELERMAREGDRWPASALA